MAWNVQGCQTLVLGFLPCQRRKILRTRDKAFSKVQLFKFQITQCISITRGHPPSLLVASSIFWLWSIFLRLVSNVFRFICVILSLYTQPNQKDSDCRIPACLMANRTAVHDVTEFSPFSSCFEEDRGFHLKYCSWLQVLGLFQISGLRTAYPQSKCHCAHSQIGYPLKGS